MKKTSRKKDKTLHISGDFKEIGSKTIDSRNRLFLGAFIKSLGTTRVKVYANLQGLILVRPMVEIPASEAWLFKNKKALASVRQGLEEAAEGNVSKLNIESLDDEEQE